MLVIHSRGQQRSAGELIHATTESESSAGARLRQTVPQ